MVTFQGFEGCRQKKEWEVIPGVERELGSQKQVWRYGNEWCI